MWREYLKKNDWILTGMTLVLLSSGLATFYAMGASSRDVLVRHSWLILIGVCVLVAVSFVDYRIFRNSSAPVVVLYIVTVIMLALTLAEREIRGSSAWLEIAGFRFEPSEFSKLALLILLAKYFSQKHIEIYRAKHVIASGIYVGIPVFLTLLQPDLGSVIAYVAIWVAILLAAGIKRKQMISIMMLGTVAVSLGWFFALKPYQKSRIVSFINPYLDPRGTGYNTIQSRVTFGSGQLTGTHFSKDNKDLPVLVPEPYTDFTFATFAQKFGLLGVSVFLIIFALFIFRIGGITARAPNNFAKLFGVGYITVIGTHLIVNGGMNVGILPITGIPFPFLSHGGSHLVTIMAGLGIVQSIKIRSSK